jgi:hypothetical protein
MREVAPGDLIFSFRDTKIAAVGVVCSCAYDAPEPDEFKKLWGQPGWKVPVAWASCLLLSARRI